ncbi:MAG: 7-carboxy-7-deazaguanine synthase QueE [Bacteroidales bacterium]|nr:7-carboxy-7-deazaguanine synthase QueE [Bacteroidales bacterium]
MYRINEIFHSLQGEGFHTGTPAVFVRFSGCNLRCNFCDTDHHDGRMMSTEEIIAEVKSLPKAPMIVLTGGEPSLFINEELVRQLKSATNMSIHIETNGTHPIPTSVDWITLSPKTGFPGGDSEPCILRKCDELKVVYTGQDLSMYDGIEANYRFLQPCYTDDVNQSKQNVQDCVQKVLDNPDWRLSLQIHRILRLK